MAQQAQRLVAERAAAAAENAALARANAQLLARLDWLEAAGACGRWVCGRKLAETAILLIMASVSSHRWGTQGDYVARKCRYMQVVR